MRLELKEEVGISQWLEDRAMNLVGEIDLALDAIVETDQTTHP
jgi:hypothetical protein